MSNHTDLTFFTNEPGTTLLERFKEILKYTKYFDVLVGYFRITGFYQLYESLEEVEKIRILVGLNVDKTTYKAIELSHNLLYLPDDVKSSIENNIVQEVEKSEDSRDVERGVRVFIDWLRSGKIEMRVFPYSKLHAKLYIARFKEDDRDFGIVITGSSNFSYAGLKDNYEFNVQLKNSNDVKYALQKFQDLWAQGLDISEIYYDTIEHKTYFTDKITPYLLYLKFLYEYFKEDLHLDDFLYRSNRMPANFKKLEYQEQAVINAKKILERYNGVFLSDVVGLGKTYMTSWLASQFPDKIFLVIAPPALIDERNPNSWPNVLRDFGVVAIVRSVGLLDQIIEEGTDRYDIVIIDEAHKFRNDDNITYEKLTRICSGKKVILVTATPLNNSPSDILSQIKLFQPVRRSNIPGVRNLELFFNRLENRLRPLDRAKNYDEYMEIVKDNSRKIRDKILKHIMIRRTRKEIEKYFKKDLKKQGIKFPEISDPKAIYYALDKRTNEIFMRTIKLISDSESFKYSRYTPLLYLKKGLDHSTKVSQKNMGSFMKILLAKRLESSFFAFRNTLGRFIESYKKFLAMYEEGYVYISRKHWHKIVEYFFNDDLEAIQKLIDDNKAEKYKSTDFTSCLEEDLRKDIETLETISAEWETIKTDPKLESFIKELKSDEILRNNKLIIFTESKETAIYLKDKLETSLGEKIIIYYGNKGRNVLKEVVANFDANAKNPKDDYRILITTEVLSEGVNLHRANVVINYDIPWNPTRVVQRVGRINRIDTPFDKVYIYNFFPTEEANDILKLKEAAEAKIKYFIETLGNDAKLLTEGEEIKSFELFSKLTSKSLFEEEDEESELKYFKVIEKIKKEKEKLFSEIKKLPKKIRVGRKLKGNELLSQNSVLTYFRKGNLEKFYLANREGSVEIDFLTAASLFEAKAQEKPKELPEDFYDLLLKNKESIQQEETKVESEAKTTSLRNKKITTILGILKTPIMRVALEENLENGSRKLNEVLDLFYSGVLPKTLIDRIYKFVTQKRKTKEILNGKMALFIFKNIYQQIPPELFKKKLQSDLMELQATTEVILSSYLIVEKESQFYKGEINNGTG